MMPAKVQGTPKQSILSNILAGLFVTLVIAIFAAAGPVGVYWYRYEQQTQEFRQQWVDKFKDAHDTLVTYIYQWNGDDHTPEEESKLSELVGNAFSASNNYEIFVEKDPLLQGYQWALISIKQAMYAKNWSEQDSLIIGQLHSTYALINP